MQDHDLAVEALTAVSTMGFKNLVKAIRKVEMAINGKNVKEILDIEKDVAKKLRLHIKN